ncbi:MAG: alpha/beta hydrolase family protein [Pseudomonadales bacterium]
MPVRTLLLITTIFVLGCQAPEISKTTKLSKKLPYAVGMKKILLEDSQRNRSLPVSFWYPATGESNPRAVNESIYIRNYGSKEADAKQGRFPLVMLSHGTGGTAASMLWIAEYLAGHGYWVAGVDHPGDSWPNATPEGLIKVWERPQDLSVIVYQMQQDERFQEQIDFSRVAALGHSSGGYTVLALAGALYNPADLWQHCATKDAMPACNLADKKVMASTDYSSASNSYKDPRFKAAVVMAPAINPGLTQESLSSIDIPIQLIMSERDELLGDTPNRMAKWVPNVTVTSIPAAGHFVYISPCNEIGKGQVAQICADSEGVDRAMIQRKLKSSVLGFLNSEL